MKKLLSMLLVLIMAAGMSVSALAATTEVLGDTNFPQRVDASGKWVSKPVDGRRGAKYRIYGFAYESMAKDVLRILNKERTSRGLAALTWEEDLYQPAIQRALEQ